MKKLYNFTLTVPYAYFYSSTTHYYYRHIYRTLPTHYILFFYAHCSHMEYYLSHTFYPFQIKKNTVYQRRRGKKILINLLDDPSFNKSHLERRIHIQFPQPEDHNGHLVGEVQIDLPYLRSHQELSTIGIVQKYCPSSKVSCIENICLWSHFV